MSHLETWVSHQSQTLAQRLVVPLFRDPTNAKLIGCGFFVRSATRLYLVSAQHVFASMFEDSDAKARGIDVHLFFYVASSTVRRIEGRLLTPNSKFDVAVLQYPKGSEIEWHDGHDRLALSVDDLVAAAPSGGALLVAGFPASRAIRDSASQQLKVRPFAFLGRPSSTRTTKQLIASPTDQFAVDFDQRKATIVGSRQQGAPKPAGMSGSPVWQLSGDDDGQMQTHLVGIAIEHHSKQRAVVCTRISHVVELILAVERDDEGL